MKHVFIVIIIPNIEKLISPLGHKVGYISGKKKYSCHNLFYVIYVF